MSLTSLFPRTSGWRPAALPHSMGHFLQMLRGEPLVMARLVNGFVCLQIFTEHACDHIFVLLGETIRKILDFPSFFVVKNVHVTLYGQ